MYFNFGLPSVMWLVEDKPADGRKCPLCGATSKDIEKTGKAGCAQCYQVFADVLDPYIAKIHGTVAHTGRVPGGGTPQQKMDKALNELRGQLKSAVAAEEFEQAALLRDRIKEMEAGK